ncbi:MAG: C2H2-type zinc finger protein [Dehalococcoidales bacterium]|nr:C2H2-type zinc finger protein [Dehalococcoidales bacterium]
MFKCNLCNRSFKTRQALGGHVSRAHPNGSVSATDRPPEATVKEDAIVEQPAMTDTVVPAPSKEETAVEQPIAVEVVAPAVSTVETNEANAVSEQASEAGEIPVTKVEEEEETQSEQIKRCLEQGYTFRQLVDKLGFKESTVRQEMVKLIAPEGEKMIEEAASGDGIPMTRKAGSGMEVLNPEAVLRRYTDGSIEDEIELRGMMKLRAAMLMVMDLVNVQKEAAEADARRIRPVLELMKEAREEQDAAAQRARSSNIEIADKAAYETAGQLSQVISQNNTRITDSINQLRQAIGGKEENPLAQFMNSIQSMQQFMGMFGVAMPGMPGQIPGGGPQIEQWQPPPITRHKRNESQGGENV